MEKHLLRDTSGETRILMLVLALYLTHLGRLPSLSKYFILLVFPFRLNCSTYFFAQFMLIYYLFIYLFIDYLYTSTILAHPILSEIGNCNFPRSPFHHLYWLRSRNAYLAQYLRLSILVNNSLHLHFLYTGS